MRNVDKQDVPAVTVPRLALYLRKLRELRSRGVDRVSSKDLAEMIGLNAAQIRKDFSYFGEFGTRGVGYEVAYALSLGKPVLCLYQEKRAVSKMITGNTHPNIHVEAYRSVPEAVASLRAFLKGAGRL